ncbi:MAG: hypothetical protein WA840_21070 [Caulobacteraceae bacterium]
MVGASNNLGAQLTPPARPSRSEAAKAAQKAFFQAALNNSQAPSVQATVAAAASEPLAPTQASSVNLANFDPDNPLARTLRPGSLVDVRV